MKPRPQTAWVAVRRSKPSNIRFAFGIHQTKSKCMKSIEEACVDIWLMPARVTLTPAKPAKKQKGKART